LRGFNSSEHRLTHHDHPWPAAKWSVIYRQMTIGRKVTDVGQVIADQSFFSRSFGDTRTQHRAEHLRKKRQDVDSLALRHSRVLGCGTAHGVWTVVKKSTADSRLCGKLDVVPATRPPG